MSVYLIDYENVKNLSGIGKLSENDVAVIFYSKNANALTFETHRELQASKARIEYKCVEVGGKNALDFQLSSYLGYVVKSCEGKDCRICVVSKDKGFNFPVSFWKDEKNIDVELSADLFGKTQSKEAGEKNSAILKALKNSACKLKDEETEKIIEIISQFKTKQAINSNLNSYFCDSKKVGEINKVIKPFIKDKK